MCEGGNYPYLRLFEICASNIYVCVHVKIAFVIKTINCPTINTHCMTIIPKTKLFTYCSLSYNHFPIYRLSLKPLTGPPRWSNIVT